MMELRPIVTDDQGVILGGNMRFRALQHLNMKEIPDNWVKRAAELTDEERRRFIVTDNVGFGDWDIDDLAANWDREELDKWGVEVDFHKAIDKAEEGDLIEVEKSVQIEPPKEYILIMAEPNSVEWEELKETLKLKMVRRGGYKKGSPFEAVGLERVITWQDFKTRINVNSSTE